jgi:hypothetical protein
MLFAASGNALARIAKIQTHSLHKSSDGRRRP